MKEPNNHDGKHFIISEETEIIVLDAVEIDSNKSLR